MIAKLLGTKARSLAGIQYAGANGISKACIEAVVGLIQTGAAIVEVRIVTCEQSHGLLITLGPNEYIAIQAGFASGYPGEGPRSFSYVLTLLEFHEVDIEEIKVDWDVLNRLNASGLTKADLQMMVSARPVRPTQWHDYQMNVHDQVAEQGRLWEEFEPVMPYAIIDPRISDLAKEFRQNSGGKLMAAFIRLEEIVQERSGIEGHGQALFNRVFSVDGGLLGWPSLSASEQKGRIGLFTGTFAAFRNPRAHREIERSRDELLAEFLQINMLYRLEREAVTRQNATGEA